MVDSHMFDKVFISYASEDFPFAEQLYNYLLNSNFTPWLDKKSLLPGQNWDFYIKKALREAHYIIILLSKNSVQKRGYVQKEFKTVLSYCEEKLDDDIYLIPVKINDCEVPENLSKYQWVNFHDELGLNSIVTSLELQRKRFIKEENKRIAAGETFPYRQVEIQRKFSSFFTTEIAIRYFQFDSTDNESINELNAIINGDVVKYLVRLRQRFFKDFKHDEIDDELPLRARQFSFDKDLKPELVTKQMVSFSTFSYEFTGGAHGNYASWGETYLLNPLREIVLEDCIDFDDKEKCLTFFTNYCSEKISNLKREYWQNDEETYLSDLGHFKMDKNWELFQCYFFSKSGLEVIFNPYVVGSYAFGQHIINIPYDELIKVLSKPDSIQRIRDAANC